MPKASKAPLLKDLKEKIKGTSPARLKTLLADPLFKGLYELYSVHSKTVAISSAHDQDIRRILGFEIDENSTLNKSINWFQERKFEDEMTPTALFTQYCNRIEKYFKIASEPLTRSWVDLFVTEALEHSGHPGQMLKVFGEISLSKTNLETGETLSGYGDYLIGYGEGEGEPLTKNLLIIGEAKCARVALSISAQRQLLAYMAIAHLARKEGKKPNSNVFGFLSNKESWIFFRIDNAAKIWKSRLFQFPLDQSIILQYLIFIVETARASSALTTPYASEEDLRRSCLHSSWAELPNFEPLHQGSSCKEEQSRYEDPPGYTLERSLAEESEDEQ